MFHQISIARRLLLNRLVAWGEKNWIIASVHAGFQKSKSTIDQCFVISQLISKYMVAHKQTLFVMFKDLSLAFDLI